MYAVRFSLLIAVLVLALSGSGCASIVHGSSQEVSIASEPSGAEVWIDGEKVGKTPVTPSLKRKRAHQVVIRKKGYQEEHRILHRVLSGAVAGNILAGGLIGWGVDAVTGAQWRLVPEMLHVELDPLPPGAAQSGTGSRAERVKERLAAVRAVSEAGGLTPEEASVIRRAVTAELAGGTPAPPSEIPPDERIVDLWNLVRQGLITEKEYTATKRSVLAELQPAAQDQRSE